MGSVVSGEGAGEVLEGGVDLRQEDRKAGVIGRLLNGGAEEVKELRLAVIAQGVEGGFLRGWWSHPGMRRGGRCTG